MKNQSSSLATFFCVTLVAVAASAAGEGGAPTKPEPAPLVATPALAATVAPAVVATAAPSPAGAVTGTALPAPGLDALAADGAKPGTGRALLPADPVNPDGAFTLAAAVMTIFVFLTIGGFLAALGRSSTWSVGDALSEEAGNQPTLPAGQKPIMVASASRTIALFGLFVVIGGFLGIAYFIVWGLFHDRSLAGLDRIMPFFYGSAAIFAPYAVNQMKEAFISLSAGTQAAPSQAPAGGSGSPAPVAVVPVVAQPVVAALPQIARPPITVQPVQVPLASMKG